MATESEAEKTIVTYSLKASESQNEDSEYCSYLRYEYANTSEADYKLSKLQVFNKQKFAAQDFEQALQSGKLEYLKQCDEMHICPCEKLLQLLDSNTPIIGLNHYGIGPKGTLAFSSIVAINGHINELQLSNNSIDVHGANALFSAWQENSAQPIVAADLSGNGFGAISADIECCTELGNLLQTDHSIKSLNLSKCNLKSHDIEKICEGLANNTCLNKLNLSQNDFDANGCWQYVSEALKENSTLRELDLSWNSMSDAGFEFVLDGLMENTGLTKLNLSWCSVYCASKSAIQKLGKFLEEDEYLEVLDLSNNNIGDDAVEVLVKGIKQTGSLKKLNIFGNPLSGNAIAQIQEALNESNVSLVKKLDENEVAKRNIQFVQQMKQYHEEYEQVIQSNENILKSLNAVKQQTTAK